MCAGLVEVCDSLCDEYGIESSYVCVGGVDGSSDV